MADFQGALSRVIKWSVGQNRFDQDGKFPKQLSLFIPQDSVAEFAAYLTALAQDPEKVKPGKIWDYNQNEEVEVDGIYINAKGQTGQYGDFGNINPVALGNTPAQQSTQAPGW